VIAGRSKRRPLWSIGLAFALVSCATVSPPTLEDLLTGTIQGDNLAYQEHGIGPPLVLIHGLGASRFTWRYLIGPLAHQRKVIAVDLKGFGESPKPQDGRYSVYDQAAHVIHLIKRLDLKNITLIGHSFGGGVALAAALRLIEEPERLDCLILLSTVAYEQRFPTFVRLLRAPLIGPMLARLVPASYQVRWVLRQAYYDKKRIEEPAVATYTAALRLPGARQALIATARQIVPVDLDELIKHYPSLAVPNLILWGRKDTITPLSIGKRIHRALPESTLAIINDTGHIPQEEKSSATLARIQAFLRQNAANCSHE
jgi:pimeloyl-ACP methyl ester carboxylesterase